MNITVPLIASMFLDLSGTGNVSYLNARHMNLPIGRFISQDSKKQFSGEYNYGNGRIMLTADYSGNMMMGDEIETLIARPRPKAGAIAIVEHVVKETMKEDVLHTAMIQTTIEPIGAGVPKDLDMAPFNKLKENLDMTMANIKRSREQTMDMYAGEAGLPDNYKTMISRPKSMERPSIMPRDSDLEPFNVMKKRHSLRSLKELFPELPEPPELQELPDDTIYINYNPEDDENIPPPLPPRPHVHHLTPAMRAAIHEIVIKARRVPDI